MGNDNSTTAALSMDGSTIVFASEANNFTDGDDNSWSDVYARVLAPRMTGRSPSFPPVRPDGDVTAVVRLEHGTGFGPSYVTSTSVTGADKDQFTIRTADTCRDRVFYPGDTCRIPVRFRPTGEAGVRTARLEVRIRGRSEPVVVPLRATVDQPLVGPVLTTSSLDLSFGQRGIATSGPDTPLEVTNRGDTEMTVTAVEISSMTSAVPETALDYRIVSDACTNVVLAPGDKCVITVAHSPRAAGDRPAALLVTGTGDQSQLVLLNGSGIAPKLVASPSVGTPSRPTMMSGTGLPPGQRVELTSPGHQDRATATVRPDATFTTPLLLFSGTAPGPRIIRRPCSAPTLSHRRRPTSSSPRLAWHHQGSSGDDDLRSVPQEALIIALLSCPAGSTTDPAGRCTMTAARSLPRSACRTSRWQADPSLFRGRPIPRSGDLGLA